MLVICDRSFRILRRSKVFCFEEQAIEFCVGLSLDAEKEEVIMTYGVWDTHASLIKLKLSEVVSFCKNAVRDPQDLYLVSGNELNYYRNNVDLLRMAHNGVMDSYYNIRNELMGLTDRA
jgi:hypothetical protein